MAKCYALLSSHRVPAGAAIGRQCNDDNKICEVRLLDDTHVLIEINWRHVAVLTARALRAKGRRSQAGPIRVSVAPGCSTQVVLVECDRPKQYTSHAPEVARG